MRPARSPGSPSSRENWFRDKDSNLGLRVQGPPSYRWTIPEVVPRIRFERMTSRVSNGRSSG